VSGGRVSRALEAARLRELIERVASGNEGALTQLYDETSSRVYGAALQMLRSPRSAAEVTQEVYMEIWQQASGYDTARGTVLAWMMSVLHSRCTDRIRASDKDSDREWYPPVNGNLQFDRGSDEMLESALGAERARDALDSLPDIQRQALTLAYFDGYSQTEVASLLGLPLDQVNSRIRDGLMGLRDALGVST
jgi:RNA polymerase sigma-70 factor, ECF subfamily